MPPDLPPRTDNERPLDAIVTDSAPHGDKTASLVGPRSFDRGSAASSQSAFAFQAPAPAQFVVPQRFGMSAIIGIMTALAVLFGCLHRYDAHPAMYLFFGVQAIVICLAQMFNGKTPRAASAITGAILLPLFLILMAAHADRRHPDFGEMTCLLVSSFPIGAFLGYVTGTMAAGVFLLMNAAERLLASSPVKSSGGDF